MNLNEFRKVLTSKTIGTRPSSYKKKIPGGGLTKVEKHCCGQFWRRKNLLLLPGLSSVDSSVSTEKRIILNSVWELNFEDGKVNLNGLCLTAGCRIDCENI